MGRGDLFGETCQDQHLFPYWREQLIQGMKDVFHFRHNVNTTGWSLASMSTVFAKMLYDSNQMSDHEYRRWMRFKARINRWERRKWRM
jgi:hypothetical protein